MKCPPLGTRICPYPFFEATPPGTAPGLPVKTGARCKITTLFAAQARVGFLAAVQIKP